MFRSRLCIAATVALTALAGRAATVTNVRAVQRPGSEWVDIAYDLGGSQTPEQITVEASSDGGISFGVPVATLGGDVGTNATLGTNRHIEWDAGTDWNGHDATRLVVRVTAVNPEAGPAPSGMAYIGGGEFEMGDPRGEGPSYNLPDYAIPHYVYVSSFYMDRTEVSVGQLTGDVFAWGMTNGYVAGLGGGEIGDQKASDPAYDPDDFPAANVRWYTALIWCNARSEMEGLNPCYYRTGAVYRARANLYDDYDIVCDWSANGYRLPTEAEWEYAARGGTAGRWHRYPWGTRINHGHATYWSLWTWNEFGDPVHVYSYDDATANGPNPDWILGLSPWTAPVATFAANGYGLHDVVGNIAEMCWDTWSETYYRTSPWMDPRGPGEPPTYIQRQIVLRGGDCNGDARACRITERAWTYADSQSMYDGFRCVRQAPDDGPSAGHSPGFVLDTSGPDPNPGDEPHLVTVSGRVVDERSKTSLRGAEVSLQGRTVTAGLLGDFSFANIDLRVQNQLLVRQTGYLERLVTVPDPGGQRTVDMGDIALAEQTERPVVESLTPDLAGVLLPGFGLVLNASAVVNWNGNPPAAVHFYANNEKVGSVTHLGDVYEQTIPVDAFFGGAFGIGKNYIHAVAETVSGKISNAKRTDITVIPLPVPLAAFVLDPANIKDSGHVLELEMVVPDPAFKKVIDLPVLGKFGAEVQDKGTFKYDLKTGVWEVTWGRAGKTANVVIGGLKVGTAVEGYGRGVANATDGIRFDELAVKGTLALVNDFELARYGVADMLAPGASTALRRFPRLKKLLDVSSIIVWFKPALAGSLEMQMAPETKFKALLLQGSAAIEGSYEPKLEAFAMKLYVGGEPRVAFQVPGDLFKEIGFKLYAGAEFTKWGYTRVFRYVWVDYSYPNGKRLDGLVMHDVGNGYVIEATVNRRDGWQSIEPVWRARGSERFLAGNRIALDVPTGTGANAQTLVSNVFPEALPALAANGNQLMLLYARDTGSTNPVQFTELAAMRYDGANWSTPRPIVGDGSTLIEGFNDDGPPTGWTVDDDGDLSVDFISESEQPYGELPTEGARMARINCYAVDSGTTRLRQTLPVSTLGLPVGTRVAFDWLVDEGYTASNDRAELFWSTDGADWHSLGVVSRYRSGDTAWITPSHELPAGAVGQAGVYFAFDITSEWGNDCHIDNLRFLGSGGGAAPGAQFAPTVAFDGNGKAVAAWEQVRDPAFLGEELEEMAAQMEIVTSTWEPATGEWSAPLPLTDNTHLDHAPRLAGPMTDGDLLLTWLSNRGNAFMGEGAPGTASNTVVMCRRWDAGTAAWGPPTAIVSDLVSEQNVTFAGRGTRAIVALTRDSDGDLADESDTEIWFREWSETTASWGTLTRLTSDIQADLNVRLAVDASGTAYCAWLRGDDLVLQRNFTGPVQTVRTNATTLGFAALNLVACPTGGLVVVWEETSPKGADPYYRVYDPTSGTWTEDGQLANNSDVEGSFAPTWEGGELVLAHVATEVSRQTVTVDAGGTPIEVDGVPQPAQTDLVVTRKSLVRDLAVVANSVGLAGDSPLPGANVTLTGRVVNAGDIPVRDAAVAFYDGDSTTGNLLGTVTIPGWLRGGAATNVALPWTIPYPSQTRTITVVVDPADGVVEANEANNEGDTLIGKLELALRSVSGSVLTNGAVRVVCCVTNIQGPVSPVLTLELRDAAGINLLADASVPGLAAGEAADVVLSLPEGSQAEGVTEYSLLLDPTRKSGDVDIENNALSVSLALWIDDDGDGIPHAWEQLHGMSDADPSDATLDRDGDGHNALAEYRSGTDPERGDSYFHLVSPAVTSGGGAVTCRVSWASVSGQVYRVWRGSNMTSWESLHDNLPATPPTNTLTDVVEPLPEGIYYRISTR